MFKKFFIYLFSSFFILILLIYFFQKDNQNEVTKDAIDENQEQYDDFLNHIQQANYSKKTAINSDIKKDIDSAAKLQRAFNYVAKKNLSSVVSIQVLHVINTSYQNRFRLDDFFPFPFFREPQSKEVIASGSGFIISKDGYLISNYHVVENATEIRVILYNEEEYKAELIGSDRITDIALLKIKPNSKKEFPAAVLGNSEEMEVGDLVVAIGNPLGFSHTFTTGVVSAKGRSRIKEDNPYQSFIQTDVAINRGNSGGPLINLYGNVIGINSMIYSENGGNIGLGFAIPINLAKEVISELKKSGEINRGWIGVALKDINKKLLRTLSISEGGTFVTRVYFGSSAYKAGIKSGDIIYAINGEKLKNTSDFRARMLQFKEGDKPVFSVVRSKKQIKITVPLISNNNDQNLPTSKKYFGFTTHNMTPYIMSQLGLRSQVGVVIEQIDKNSILWNQGLREGHLLLFINETRVDNIDDYENVMKRALRNDFIYMRFRIGGYVQAFKLRSRDAN